MNFYQLNFGNLGAITDVSVRMDALYAGINYALAAPYNAMELMGGAKNLALMSSVFHGKSAITPPSEQQIKAFIGNKYTVAADTPELSNQSARFQQWFNTSLPQMDMGWMALFDDIQLEGTPHSGFDIGDTNQACTFVQIKPGSEIKIEREITESSTPCEMIEWGAGVGILDIWIEDQKFWKVQDSLDTLQGKYWSLMATKHYALFTEQSAGIDVNFDTDDTKTFNKAAATMLRSLEGSGYGIGENPGFYILTSPEQKGRIEKMLMATQGSLIVAYNANKQPITYTVRGVIATTKVAAADTGYYLILPGIKNKKAIKRRLSIEGARDIYRRANDLAATTRFNAIVGNASQVRRVKFA